MSSHSRREYSSQSLPSEIQTPTAVTTLSARPFLVFIHLPKGRWRSIICRQISLTCGRSPDGAPHVSVQVRSVQFSSPRRAVVFIRATLLNIDARTHAYTNTPTQIPFVHIKLSFIFPYGKQRIVNGAVVTTC